MDNMVLKTENLELPTQRLLTKLQFLQQENIQLNLQIYHIQKELKQTKEQITILISQKPCNEIAQQLLNEIQEKSQIIIELSDARDKAQAETLLNNQVAQEAERFYMEIINEYEEKIQELRRIIHDKEYSIQELEKIKPIQEGDNIITRHKEIVSLNEQTLRYHLEIENFSQSILKQSREITRLNEQSCVYLQENRNLKFEISKIKYALQNQVNFSKIKECITKSYEVLSEDEFQLVNLKKPVKIVIRSTEFIDENPKGKSVNTYMNSFMSPKNDRQKRLESDCERYKKLYERENITTKLLSNQLETIQTQTQILVETNETLIKAHKVSAQSKYQFEHNYQFLDSFWKKYLQKISNGHEIIDCTNNVLMPEEEILIPEEEILILLEDESIPQIQRSRTLNIITKKGEIVQEIKDIALKDSQVYLLNLAKDLNSKLDINKNILIKPLRSLSVFENSNIDRKIIIPSIRNLQKLKQQNASPKKIQINDDISVIFPNQYYQNENLPDRKVDASFASQSDLFQI